MTAEEVIALAREHIGKGFRVSSARLCLADARRLWRNGDDDASKRRAVDSLRYSVGVLHADYQRAVKSL